MRVTVIKYSFLLVILMGSFFGFSQDIISVTPVSFNSPNREYAPIYFKNGLVFISVSRSNKGLTYIDYKTGNQLSNLYFISLIKDSISEVTLFSQELESSFHDGPITFSKDGNTAYFTRSQTITKKLRSSKKEINKFAIYKTTFDGNSWINIQSCSFNSEEFNTGQPSLSSDGTKLLFASDKEGGFGGIDIYSVDIVDGNFGPMVNLGESINSVANEMFPFIDTHNKLYYSSDRTTGYGGLDLYVSSFLDEIWSKGNLMDTTVNSAYDDFSLVFNESEVEGYFASNRSGSDDIYKIEITYPEFNECEELVSELLCYEFYEEATLNADSVAMVYEWDFGDGTKEQSLETYHCYAKSGLYIVELNIMDTMVAAMFVNEATYELEIEAVIQPEIIVPDTISIYSGLRVTVNQGKWKDYQIDNYYIDYGDSTIKKNDKNLHKYKFSGYKELKVLIAGVDEITQEIKTNCFYKTIFVTSEMDEFIAQNKFSEQLKYTGYSADKVEEDEAKRYRLEIISTLKSVLGDSVILKEYLNFVEEVYDTNLKKYSYVIGSSTNPFDLIEDYRKSHNRGFNNAVVKSFPYDKIKIEELGVTHSNELGEVSIVLNNIQFEYDGYHLNKDSKIELQKLIQYLKDNADIRIEIGAHTDAARNIEKAKAIFAAKGKDYSKLAHDKMSRKYNKLLSQKRAQSVSKYLYESGIAKRRLESKGYGEREPLEPNFNSNETDNPLGRAKNRRVSFKILPK